MTIPDLSKLVFGPYAGVDRSHLSLVRRPEFYLAYLIFYFFTWLFQPPGWIDIAVAVIAIAVFLPIYFRSFEQSHPRYIWYVVALEAIALATAPFVGNGGTFHIFAASQAGFQRPRRRAILLAVSLSVVWLSYSLAIGSHWAEIIIPLFIGAFTAAICIASAEEQAHQDAQERARELDRQQAARDERERIARDLHDVLGHTVTMAALKADLASRMFDTDPERARQEIRDIATASREALMDVRATIAAMQLTTLADEIARGRMACEAAGIDFQVEGSIPDMARSSDEALGLGVREALTNVIRHAHAGRVTLSVRTTPDRVEIICRDDGIGGADMAGSGGSGLRGLAARMQGLGGDLSIVSDMSGTRVSFHVPVAA